MTLIALDDNRKVNPAHVASVVWDRRHYANTGPDSTLVITMANGEVHRVRHGVDADAYAVEDRLKKAARDERQFLVDLCFELAISAARDMGGHPKESVAAFVTGALNAAGIRTLPRGMSWGVIVDE